MKKKLVFSLIATIMAFTNVSAQLDSATFDFWVGKWDAEWQNPQGVTEKGKNFIEKTLDGKVLQEHFEILTGANKGFLGTSISVYNPRTQSYHQAWADNTGGYINLVGEVIGDQKIFKTLPKQQGDLTLISRMIFYDIKQDSFTWDWELSKDNGATWQLQWRINYTRSK